MVYFITRGAVSCSLSFSFPHHSFCTSPWQQNTIHCLNTVYRTANKLSTATPLPCAGLVWARGKPISTTAESHYIVCYFSACTILDSDWLTMFPLDPCIQSDSRQCQTHPSTRSASPTGMARPHDKWENPWKPWQKYIRTHSNKMMANSQRILRIWMQLERGHLAPHLDASSSPKYRAILQCDADTTHTSVASFH